MGASRSAAAARAMLPVVAPKDQFAVARRPLSDTDWNAIQFPAWGRVDLDELSARAILDSMHVAWSNGDVARMLPAFDEDIVYWCNASASDGQPLTVVGKPAFADLLKSVRAVTERVSVAEYFRLIDGVGRAQVDAFIRHRRTGHTLVTTFRQVVRFRGERISRIEEYHDAAKMGAFWRLIAGDLRPDLLAAESEPAAD